MNEQTSEPDVLRRVLWVLNRTTVTPADWHPGALVVERKAAYPEGAFYPTAVTLYPLPGEDRWWGPDSDFVAEDRPDGGFSLAEALALLADVTVQLAAHERRKDDSSWWDSMAGNWWLP